MTATEPADSASYTALRTSLRELPRASSDAERVVKWVDSQGRLGVSRDELGRIELFVVAPALVPTSSVLAANLAYDAWQRANADRIVANRLRLPPEPHFDSVAAFLCTELLDNGLLLDAPDAFRRSEPVLEMAFARSRLVDESMVGLLGELLLLRALLRHRPNRSPELIGAWHGSERSSRDFQLGAIGVEVKTTRGSKSRHHIHGVRQVEPGHSVSGAEETRLFLLSVGIEAETDPSPGAQSWTLPSLLDDIIELIGSDNDSTATVGLLLGRIKEYGEGSGVGYDHWSMRDRVAFGVPWKTAFVRLYDMGDPTISVLRTLDLARFPMVDADSLEFVIELPEQVHGDVNPVVGLQSAVSAVLGAQS